MKAAGGQARESRDDIGIGSVRQPGERGTAIDKPPRLLAACHDSRHKTSTSPAPTSTPKAATLTGFKCDIDAYPQPPAAFVRRDHNASPTIIECALNHFNRPELSPSSRHFLLFSLIRGLAANALLLPPWLRPSTTMTSRFP